VGERCERKVGTREGKEERREVLGAAGWTHNDEWGARKIRHISTALARTQHGLTAKKWSKRTSYSRREMSFHLSNPNANICTRKGTVGFH
jgi:hypothetical protein